MESLISNTSTDVEAFGNQRPSFWNRYEPTDAFADRGEGHSALREVWRALRTPFGWKELSTGGSGLSCGFHADRKDVPLISSSRLSYPTAEQEPISLKTFYSKKLQNFCYKEAGWDGYNGVPASEEAAADTFLFIDRLAMDLEWPRIGLSGDGEIGLFWDWGRGFIDVGFVGGGSYSYYARNAHGEEIFGDDIDANGEIDRDLFSFIANYE